MEYQHLTQQQRYIIQDLQELRKSKALIAEEVGVHRSTIYREIKRHCNAKGGYNAKSAQIQANNSRRTAIDYPRKIKGVLEEIVKQKLIDGWSPEQISGRLKLEKEQWSISHECIYRWIYSLWPGYKVCLRHQGRRQKRGGKRKRRGLGKMPRKYIDVRPTEANDRTEIGHWERDLVEGQKGKSSLLVIVDRKSRYSYLEKVQSHYAEHVSRKTRSVLNKSNVPLKSVTNDNGVEFGEYQKLERQLNVPVYYCHAYTSWERGTVENTNGLIRQYFPKKTNFDGVSNKDVKAVQNSINYRPRKILDFKTPEEIHYNKKQKLIKGEKSYRLDLNRRLEKEFYQSLIHAGVIDS